MTCITITRGTASQDPLQVNRLDRVVMIPMKVIGPVEILAVVFYIVIDPNIYIRESFYVGRLTFTVERRPLSV